MDSPATSARARSRILLADDNEPFRRQVRNLLGKESDLELVGETGDGDEAVRLAGELKPDVVVMDIMMPHLNGIEATRRITSRFPAIKVIGLSIHGDQGFRRAMLDGGALMYLLKDNVVHELPRALRAIADGSASATDPS